LISFNPNQSKEGLLLSPRILYIINDPAFFLSHRLPVALEAKRSGYEVIVATGPGEGVEDILAAGLGHHCLPLARGGMNPWAELRLLGALARLYRSVKPDLVHLVTIKPVLYGGILARLMKVPSMVAAISGMGYLFTGTRQGVTRRIAEVFYSLALGHRNCKVIVQNQADREALQAMGALGRKRDVLIPGSGVDLEQFWPSQIPQGPPLVVLPARMLWDKGVGEFVQAAEILRKQGADARFVLVGAHDPHNPSGVPLEQLETWQAQGSVEWWGQCRDMPEVLAKASLVVLPSYREGMPKALLEAAATGRAIVTSDAPGCRDVVEPGKNGELVPIKDAQALAQVIGRLLGDRKLLETMGRRSREKAEAEFGVERVVAAHMEIYRELLAGEDRR
jgi:glycosyltransferase involved in cell wall biosynthesis